MKKSSLALISVLFLLPACEMVMRPSPLAAGYTYHQGEFKAPPGPMAAPVGYDFTPARNEAVLRQWHDVAQALFAQLESGAGLQSGQSIYLEYTRPNVFNASFDDALRAAIRGRGYVLATNADEAVIRLRPSAFLAQDQNIGSQSVTYNGDRARPPLMNPQQQQDFIFMLQAFVQGKELGAAQGRAPMPAFGYVRGQGQPGYPVTPSRPQG